MAITPNHTIVPAHDQTASAEFFARIFGLRATEMGHFAAVAVNDTLTLDFDSRKTFESHHYAFQVGNQEFDAIFARVKAEGLSYSADPFHRRLGETYHHNGSRGFYFYDPNGHNLEVLTRP